MLPSVDPSVFFGNIDFLVNCLKLGDRRSSAIIDRTFIKSVRCAPVPPRSSARQLLASVSSAFRQFAQFEKLANLRGRLVAKTAEFEIEEADTPVTTLDSALAMEALAFASGMAVMQGFSSLRSSFTQNCTVHHSSRSQAHRTKLRRCDIYCRRGSKHRDRRFGDGRRSNRVSELVKREISALIDDGYRRAFFHDKSAGPLLLSVVDVRCSDDLRHARVQVSIMGSTEQKDNTMKWLRGARKGLRGDLARRVYLKHTPELMFEESQMAEAVNTVNIINEIAAENERKREMADFSRGSQTKDLYENDLFDKELELDASLDDAIIADDMEDYDDSGLFIDVEDADEDEECDESHDKDRTQRDMSRENLLR